MHVRGRRILACGEGVALRVPEDQHALHVLVVHKVDQRGPAQRRASAFLLAPGSCAGRMHGGGSHWLFSSIFILPTSAILNEAGRVSPTRATIQSTQGFAAPPSSSSSDMLCVGGRLAHPLQCKPAVCHR